jgi:glycine/D-amino acid oxidase-like deaminating enzyme
MKDILIIGQGAAGSFLAWELLKRDKKILIVDDDHKRSSSMISAGIINPVTGKRFAIMQDFDLFFAHALGTYRELEAKFDQKFFEPMDILRVFQNESERDHWQRKVELNQGKAYNVQTDFSTTDHPAIKGPLGSVVIKRSGFCHTARLLTTLKEYFQDQDILARQKFSYDDLVLEDQGVRFGGEMFRAVIFCEGYQAQWNPWFDWIPFNSVKGEILKVEIQGGSLPSMIINKGKWCAPLGQQQWMAGSTYIWDKLDCEPTPEARDQIVDGLNQCFENTIRVIEHNAGVRPVINDQKLVVGRHPKLSHLAIFNGLGSKGFLMAPYYAAYFADYLDLNSDLEKNILNEASTKKYLYPMDENSLSRGPDEAKNF